MQNKARLKGRVKIDEVVADPPGAKTGGIVCNARRRWDKPNLHLHIFAKTDRIC